MSRRKIDMRAEQELALYLDNYFYRPLANEGTITSFSRITDTVMQRNGVDVKVKKENRIYYIDEKAQLYYINKHIPTFAFELSFTTADKERKIGWFLNDELLTNIYFLLWPDATTIDLSKITMASFTHIQGFMIEKKKLIQYLWKFGLDKETLKEKNLLLLQQGIIGKVPSGIQGVYFYVSHPSDYSEQPVNLIIGKAILEECAFGIFDISPASILRVK